MDNPIEQVQILNRIATARRHFIDRFGIAPDLLYLGIDEYLSFARECSSSTMYIHGATYMNMVVWEVHTPSHFHMASSSHNP